MNSLSDIFKAKEIKGYEWLIIFVLSFVMIAIPTLSLLFSGLKPSTPIVVILVLLVSVLMANFIREKRVGGSKKLTGKQKVSAVILGALIIVDIICMFSFFSKSNIQQPVSKQIILSALEKIYDSNGEIDAVVYTSNKADNYYVQAVYIKKDATLRVEVVGNNYLAEKYKLSPEKINKILSLGFNDNGENYFFERQVGNSSELNSVAETLYVALKDIYGVNTFKVKTLKTLL